MARELTHGVEVGRGPDPIAAARDAWLKGTDPEIAVYGTSSEPVESESSSDAELVQSGTVEPEEVQHAETPSLEVVTEVDTPEMDIETLYVKDSSGKKQKLEISYKDKEKIKEAFLKAAGMRKFQTERDLSKKELADLKKKHEELSNDFGKLDRIYKENGARGLFEALGGSGAWEKAVESELESRQSMASMSPEERMQRHFQEKEKTYQSEKSELESKYKSMLDKINQEQETATLRTLESKLVPAFEKHNFKGKLGDDVAEEKINRAIWTEVTEKLAEYPDNIDLTSGIIEKEFRTASAVYSKILNKQVENRVQQTVAKKKEDATQRAQVVVKKGMTANQINSGVAEDIKNSNWSSLMQKVMSGKVKL